jgi:PTH1 family peptidyl-tRNA hydrolase
VDRLAEKHGVAVTKKKHDALVGSWHRDGEEVLLVKPQTYMNRSGEAVKSLLRYLPVRGQDVTVVFDDLDLPFGRIRIRQQGGAAGHRGMLSILQCLEDESFLRVRIGIGRPPAGVEPADFVLQPFFPEELPALEAVLAKAADAVESVLEDGPQRAMERFNRAE